MENSLVYKAPFHSKENFDEYKSIFLAGGISNCGDWQFEMSEYIKKNTRKVLVFNPRRDDFDVSKEEMTTEQIKWEYEYLHKSKAVSFWFCRETLCPITLYELGKITMTKQKLFIGIDPEYKRKMDVEVQTNLSRPDVKIVYSLKDLHIQVVEYFNKQ